MKSNVLNSTVLLDSLFSITNNGSNDADWHVDDGDEEGGDGDGEEGGDGDGDEEETRSESKEEEADSSTTSSRS